MISQSQLSVAELAESDEEDKQVLSKIEDAQNVRLQAEKSDNK